MIRLVQVSAAGFLLIVLTFFGVTARAEGTEPKLLSQDLARIQSCLVRVKDEARTCIGTVADECQMTPNGSTTPGIVACLNREKAAWDMILNQRYETAVASAKERDDELSGQSKQDVFTSLREAQRSWIVFRDAECRRILAYYKTGTIRGPYSASCQLSLTARRAIDLAPENIR